MKNEKWFLTWETKIYFMLHTAFKLSHRELFHLLFVLRHRLTIAINMFNNFFVSAFDLIVFLSVALLLLLDVLGVPSRPWFFNYIWIWIITFCLGCAIFSQIICKRMFLKEKSDRHFWAFTWVFSYILWFFVLTNTLWFNYIGTYRDGEKK